MLTEDKTAGKIGEVESRGRGNSYRKSANFHSELLQRFLATVYRNVF